MNKFISKAGAAVVSVTVFLFAVCLITDFTFGSYVVCMFLPIGYIMTAAGFHRESGEENKAAATAGLVFAAIYATLIFIVYFAQTTSVRLEELSEQAGAILDFRRGGLLFNYDLLGYGMMALSTFFIGLTVRIGSKADKWLKGLLIVHGLFFAGCFVMPMTGVFTKTASGGTGKGGTIALLVWCVYFLPVGILSFLHFATNKNLPEKSGEDAQSADPHVPSGGGKIVSFGTVTLHTSGMRHIGEDEIVMKDGKAEVSRYGIRYSDGQESRVLEKRAECSEERILKLLNDCRLLSWNGFVGPHPKGVLDGTMFTLTADVNGGKRIYAHGSQNFPKHYRDFTDGLYDILNEE